MKARVPSTVMEEILGNPSGARAGVAGMIITEKAALLGLSTSPASGEIFVDKVSCGVGSPGLEIQVPVPAGDHQVSFGPVAGYTTPSNQYLSLRAEEVRHVVGTYVSVGTPTPGGGGLNVTTTPVAAGISIDGVEVGHGSVSMTIQTGMFRNSLNIDPGSHVVSFEAFAGYTTPAPQTVNVTVGTTLNVVGTYVASTVTPPSTAKSYLQVTTTPAVNGYIYIDQNQFGIYTGSAGPLEVPAGSHTVSFGNVYGYTAPAAQTVNVPAGQTVSVVGTYVASAVPTGNLAVGAREFVNGIATPLMSAPILIDGVVRGSGYYNVVVPAGSHVVSFGAVSGYTAPAAQTVNVPAGQTGEAMGTYVKTATGYGELKVTMTFNLPGYPSVASPPVIVLDGGETNPSFYRISDGWYSSSIRATAGAHTLSFYPLTLSNFYTGTLNLPPYRTPPARTINIPDGQTLEVSVVYG